MIIQGGPVLCKCGNTARYMNERGELCCAICPLVEGIDSIKLDDVPKLLAWARDYVTFGGKSQAEMIGTFSVEAMLDRLRDIIQRKPTPQSAIHRQTLEQRAAANAQLEEDARRCCCYRPGWLGPQHDDPNCEYRDGAA